ncbi:unnamed protein product [Ostreobium quekettii]|uniref:Alpha-2-macroglobulin n=1 Tax=Ostreobium quekettii TaxID=121088 RepID=A0A8S1JH92_9CHLO|nr:unnamed protein product [Ostreobium quekettii]
MMTMGSGRCLSRSTNLAKLHGSRIYSDLPPTLLETLPTDGTAWDGGPVTFTFDQPLEPASTIAFSVEPTLAGDVVITESTLTFTPTAVPLPGARYHLLIDADATGTNGLALGTPVEISLVAATPLTVTSTQPSDGSEEIDIDSQIVIVFNKPVVELVGIDAQGTLPQPLTIEPAVDGKGEWLNTSIYVFQPALGLAGGTAYAVTVADLTGLNGEVLEPHSFSFTTASPIVTDVQSRSATMPYSSGPAIPPDSTFQISFSQPMDRESTEAALTLLQLADERLVAIDAFTWAEDSRTLTVTPTAPLDFGAEYQVTVDEAAQPASRQGNLRELYSETFQVVPLPAVANTVPLDGATEIPPDVSVVIRFNTALSETTVLPNISVTPTLTNTQVYSYFRSWENAAEVSWVKEADTTYTITVGADIADPYGNTLGDPYIFSFATGDHSSFVRMGIDRFTHFSAYTETRVSTLYRNVSSVDTRLYQLPIEEVLRLAGQNQWEIWQNYSVPDPDQNLLWERNYEPIVGSNVTARQVITLTDSAGDLLAPGFYLLEVTYPERDPEEDQGDPFANPTQALIVLSNNNLLLKKSTVGDSLAWVTDLQTGRPVGDLSVRFFHSSGSDETATNDDGIARIPLDLDSENSWTPVIAMSGNPGDPNFAATSSEWNEGIGPWDFSISGGYGVEPYQTYFYTDRPIYRPGQTIYWKGIIRQLVADQYELPATDLPVTIIIRDDQGEMLLEENHTPSANGTLNGELTLSPDAVTGFYYMEARLQIAPDRTVYGGAGIQVAAYRKPEFEINVSSDQIDYLNGDTVNVTVQANYFSGGPLANAPITWRLLSEPYFFNWQDADGRYYSFTPYDPETEDYDPYRRAFTTGMVREGIGTTNGDGTFTLELPADLSMALQSQRWTIDVTVQSPTNQFVSGRTAFPVHKGEFYIGLRPRSYVAQVGEAAEIDLVTITPQGFAYPGSEVDVTIYEFNWNSVYAQSADGTFAWQTSVERTPVFTTSVLTPRSGMETITWTPETGGQYQIAATSRDDRGNEISSAAFLWAGGRSFVAWPRENNDRIELVADKELYVPGETAKILVPSPFTGTVEALLTLERGGVLESQLVTLNGNSETLAIPITADHIPNIFVSVVLVKGVDTSNPTPAMRLGYVQLNVDTAEKALTIEVAPSAETVQPRDSVSYTLTILDHLGESVADAEVSVALIDKAVLSLAEGDTRPLLDIFYYERPLGVTTGASLNINRDRLSQQLSEGAKGGGGGGGGMGLLEVRENFPDVAYWRAALTTDENGEISFNVTLPDNLTTWTLAAKAVTAATLVGETTNDIVATKELQIRPLVPRFFTAGDEAQVSAVIRNTSEQDIDEGWLTFNISGSDIDFDTNQERFTVAASEEIRINVPIATSSTVTEVVIHFTADVEEGPALRDSVRLRIPVKRYETPEVVGTAGTVPPEGRLEAIRLPQNATENGELAMTLEPSLAAGMRDGLTYLEHFEYECNEQTVSRFLPNLFTVRALNQLEIENQELERKLNFQLGIGVQRLVSRQNDDGGWGYWPGEESTPFVTSYVLWGLVNAKAIEYTVPQRTLESAADYLDRQFQAPDAVASDWQLNEMAFMNFVLAEMGQGDPGRAVTLYAVRERLSYYGQALLAMTLANLDEDGGLNPRAQTLLNDLYGAAQLSATGAAWHEENTDWWTLNTDTRTTSMVLAAFVRLDPKQPLLPMVVRWLMSAREAGRWATTQENAWAIIALTDWMAASGELEGNYDWTVALNGNEIGAGSITPESINTQVQLQVAVAELLRDEANALQMTRSDREPSGRGQLYYTTHLRYYLDALAIDARDRGIVVDRRFELDGQSVQAASVGDVISVTVTIVAPSALHHALIEVPIPAGTEPIDPRLATTSAQYDEYGQIVPVDDGRPWWWWTPTHIDLRDEKMALIATYLPAGTYEYTFQVQATVPGEYRVLPVHGEMMYFPEVWGRSAGALFVVRE